MLTFLGRRPASRPRLLSERGQGVALLLLALAAIFLLIVTAKGHP
ncbi:hypothetical protein [Brevundimonas sp.]|nr:hypothetical protein [Brevundimonas sp.]